ncbi:hypothetical protein JCM30566_09110 [Marinitoga arctica]
MISKVQGISYQYVPNSQHVSTKSVKTVQQTSQDFEKLLNAIVYQQNGFTKKLVRIVGEMYQGQKLDILA